MNTRDASSHSHYNNKSEQTQAFAARSDGLPTAPDMADRQQIRQRAGMDQLFKAKVNFLP
ncbi:MAG: hypothetical protein KGY70_11090 [Bacteroidales bacterium]|nr:hypothetical protein [Bacteroidales bacterium]